MSCKLLFTLLTAVLTDNSIDEIKLIIGYDSGADEVIKLCEDYPPYFPKKKKWAVVMNMHYALTELSKISARKNAVGDELRRLRGILTNTNQSPEQKYKDAETKKLLSDAEAEWPSLCNQHHELVKETKGFSINRYDDICKKITRTLEYRFGARVVTNILFTHDDFVRIVALSTTNRPQW